MALAPGTRLGPYEVLGLIAAGGMGEVYRARDPRLDREVAIKVLPAEKLADPDRRARFLQEARAASALNHPNIVTIHEVESEGDLDFLVMEYVAGHSLDTIIPRQGMRPGEALRIAIPLAEALAVAHAAGIVHRDLKPANVMLTPGGAVKVLDFGLAKLTERDVLASDQATTVAAHAAPLTRMGMVAGTLGYMSPEQATGAAVDARSDIFSFGALLYELVTGRRAFAGASSAETLAAILKETPTPPREIAPDVPAELERILLRCLRKDPARRFQSMLDVKVELQEIKEESDSQAAAAVAPVARRSRRRWLALAGAGVVLAAAATAVTLWRIRPRDTPSPRVVPLSSMRNVFNGSFSPDGSQIVFSATGENDDNWDVWLTIVGTSDVRRLTTDPAEDGTDGLAWSPDGTRIAFVREGSIWIVSPLGGAERRLLEFPASSVSWSPDGRWLAASRVRADRDHTPDAGRIYLVPANGGDPRPVTSPRPPAYHLFPAFSPDGQSLAYSTCGISGNPACDIEVVGIESGGQPGVTRRLTEQHLWHRGLTWLRDGRSIVYGVGQRRDARLWRVPSDGRSPPTPIPLADPGSAPFAASAADRLGFVRRLSDADIYRWRKGTVSAPVLSSTGWDFGPQYSPDGRHIAFTSSRDTPWNELFLADADGSNVSRLTHGRGHRTGSGAAAWSPDGRTLVFESDPNGDVQHLWTIGLDGGNLRRVTGTPANETVPSWSRDGRWIYFSSQRTGRAEVWRVRLADGVEQQVTERGGYLPQESFDGGALYYTKAPGGTTAPGPLWARPTDGGSERTVIDCVDGYAYAVTREGILYISCEYTKGAAAHHPLRLWSSATGRDREVASIETGNWMPLGLAASPDGQTVLYVRVNVASDLMMIENFR